MLFSKFPKTISHRKKINRKSDAILIISHLANSVYLLRRWEKILLIVLLLAFLNTCYIEAAPSYIYHNCGSSTFASNSTYERNLYTTLSLFTTSKVTVTGFAKATTGQATPDRVLARYLCRGDLSTSICRDCVNTAVKEITELCPNKRVPIIWYDECMLRYTDSLAFGSVDTEDCITLYNIMNITNPNQFRELVEKTLSEVIPIAANSETGKKFAVKKANLTNFRTLYTLVQCMPDLAAGDCNSCLWNMSVNLQLDSAGSRSLAPSCTVRVELYRFYNESAVAVPPPAVNVVQPPPRALPVFPVRNKGRKISIVVIISPVAATAICVALILIVCCYIRRKAATEQTVIKPYESVMEYMSSSESLQFDLSTIQAATNNFAHENKLGEGGFGVVYKGTLSNGQNIAVKRLSRSSGQGANEFENEVLVVAKLQHRNLVRLFGFCLQGEEKLLVYEFVPNKSLDYFLFDLQKQAHLDWSIRYKILTGIAKGILYLHEDSRLRIIHRDLKASNILLDNEMNPKVSDFGMAKIFGVNQMEGTTNRVVGTYGYMASEYAMHGQFSIKTDVYSFGILLLEIISGKRSNYLCQSDCIEILPCFAWKQWMEGAPLEVVDSLLEDSYERSEVIKCIHIGLLCVQENPADRPTMAAVVNMLNSQTVSMVVPREPAFFIYSRTEANGIIYSKPSSSSTPALLSVNGVSITELYPR